MKARMIHDSRLGFIGLIEDENIYEKLRKGEVRFKNENTIKYTQIPHELFKRLMAADEKQSPKEIVSKESELDGLLDAFCPSCNEYLLSFGADYCERCGQALSYPQGEEEVKNEK